MDLNHDGVLQYVLLEGEEVHQDASFRTETSIKYLTESGLKPQRIGQGTAEWMRKPAYELMKKWLSTSDKKIEVVISNNDEMALGALEEVNERKELTLPAIVGIDGTKDAIEAVNNGEMIGTVINSAKLQANAIYRLIANNSVSLQKNTTTSTTTNHYCWIPYEIYRK